MKTKLTCKHCGSNNILHCERMIVGYRVESFYIDENDSIQVNSFNENEQVVPDSQESLDYPFICGDCNEDLDEEELAGSAT